MRLLHDRYAAEGDVACDLITGETCCLADAQRDAAPGDEAAIAPMAELFDAGRDGAPRWIVADARNGMRAAALQRAVADAARRRGYVPVSVALFHRVRLLLAEDLRDRALLLVGGFAGALGEARMALTAAAGLSVRPHVLLTFRTAAAALPTAVREARAAYGNAQRIQRRPAPLAPGVEEQLARADRAEGFARAGRHAAAERLLREVAGALERRRACEPAMRVYEALVMLLLERGRPRDADAVARDMLRVSGIAGEELLDRRARASEAWIRVEQGRLVEAESLLRALTVTDTSPPMPSVAVGLARCLFFQGRFRLALEALDVLGAGEDLPAPLRAIAVDVKVAALLALGRIFEAGQHATAAVTAAAASSSPWVTAVTTTARLRVLCAAGDLSLAESLLREVISLAGLAHAPLRATWARTVWAAALQRAGRDLAARRELARLQRVVPSSLPLLRRAVDAIGSPSDAGAVVTMTAREALATELIDLAHGAPDDRAAASAVLGRVAAALETSRLDLVSADGGPVTPIVSIGSGLTTSIGERVVESGIAIGVAPDDDGREAGVPVRLAAQPLAALVARWPLDRPRPACAGDLLALAAAVLAPRVEVLQWKARQDAQAACVVPELIGASAAIEDVRRAIARAARAPFAVLIEGESGTGKELVARAIHQHGPRRERRLCDVNCAALPDELIESELFGHAKGAFTGAVVDRAGLFEEANGGTLFMDEVAELSPRAQAKLLRVLQQQEVRRVGETFSRLVDVRIIAAANRDLRAEADAGRFRQDLLYRLDVIRIRMPPLRERPGDVALLARHFWEATAPRIGTTASLTPALLAGLARYHWPGNVRELQNVIAALVVAAPPRGRVGADLLPAVISEAGAVSSPRLEEARRAWERRFVSAALARAGGSRSRAATALGLSRQGLLKLLARLGVSAEPVGDLRDE